MPAEPQADLGSIRADIAAIRDALVRLGKLPPEPQPKPRHGAVSLWVWASKAAPSVVEYSVSPPSFGEDRHDGWELLTVVHVPWAESRATDAGML